MKRINAATGKPYKYGDREDGKVFRSFVRKPNGKHYEYWVSEEKFAQQREVNNLINRTRALRLRHRRMYHLRRYKKKKGCVDCGFNLHHAALHFDHIDRSQKLGTVWDLIISNLKDLMAEVRKCAIRCANCHAIRGANENHYG